MKHLVDLGPPRADLKNSPVFPDVKEERELTEPAIPEERSCYFNGNSYPHDSRIISEGRHLHCDRGAWVTAEQLD